jgi:hypothetical protein
MRFMPICCFDIKYVIGKATSRGEYRKRSERCRQPIPLRKGVMYEQRLTISCRSNACVPKSPLSPGKILLQTVGARS